MTWLWIGLLGGLVGADATSLAQSMLSRPLVSAAVTGWILGRPVEGVLIGMILEAFSLVILPIGAARYPESGTAAIAATAAYATVAGGPVFDPSLLLMAVVFGLGWEWLGGITVTKLRQLNGRVVDVPLAGPRPDLVLSRRHLLALTMDFGRGAAVALSGALAGAWILGFLGPRHALEPGIAVGALVVAGTMMIAALLPLFGGWAGRRLLFALGVVCGSVLLFLR